jgi:glycolate oxidase FAD binding subunit
MPFMTPQEPASAAELRDLLSRCGAERKKVELGGRFTKRAMGGTVAPADIVLSTARLDRVVEYEPRDLTISVEPGLRFQALQDLLAENNQMLPLDPPRPEEATVGGVVIANCSGPRRRLCGSARDMVIGMTFVTLAGEEVRSGGMVVKNVAGLDMAKLMIGSFGTLAAVARVNFKLFPRPPLEKTFLLAYDSLEGAIQGRDAVLRSVLQPAALDLVNPAAIPRVGNGLPRQWLLLAEAAGIEAVMARYDRELKTVARDTQSAEFAALEADQARRLWQGIRDFPALHHPGDTGAAVVRLSTTLARLPECFSAAASLPAVARAGNGVVYVCCPPGQLEVVRRARSAGLYAVIESSAPEDKRRLELWADPGPELEIMTRIKRSLDPDNLLNHGRLYNRL